MGLKQTLLTILNLILPPRCVSTGEIVDIPGMLSSQSWKNMPFIDLPYCNCCGLPFDFTTDKNMLCGGCIEKSPIFNQARSALIYNEHSRTLILAFKHGDKLQLTNNFSQWMIRAGRDILPKTDIITPVPLHRKRLWQRRYNQSAILAKSIAKKRSKITYTPQLLKRIRATPPQQGLTKKERLQNITNSIIIPEQNIDVIKNKNICIIDDVYTSGATINECAKILKKAGANEVYAITIARVLL